MNHKLIMAKFSKKKTLIKFQIKNLRTNTIICTIKFYVLNKFQKS